MKPFTPGDGAAGDEAFWPVALFNEEKELPAHVSSGASPPTLHSPAGGGSRRIAAKTRRAAGHSTASTVGLGLCQQAEPCGCQSGSCGPGHGVGARSGADIRPLAGSCRQAAVHVALVCAGAPLVYYTPGLAFGLGLVPARSPDRCAVFLGTYQAGAWDTSLPALRPKCCAPSQQGRNRSARSRSSGGHAAVGYVVPCTVAAFGRPRAAGPQHVGPCGLFWLHVCCRLRHFGHSIVLPCHGWRLRCLQSAPGGREQRGMPGMQLRPRSTTFW